MPPDDARPKMADKQANPRPEALDDLARRVAEARGEQQVEASPKASSHGMAVGWNMASVFVASVVVGALFGFGIDHLAGSQPWGLFVGLMFGFAAGVVSLVRTAQAMSRGVPIGQSLPPSAERDEDN